MPGNPQPFAYVEIEARKAECALEPQVTESAKTLPETHVDLVQLRDQTAHHAIELEGAAILETVFVLDVGKGLERSPLRRRDGSNHWLHRWGRVAPGTIHEPRLPRARLGRDRLGRLPGGSLRPEHAASRLERPPPQHHHPPRTANREASARLTLRRVGLFVERIADLERRCSSALSICHADRGYEIADRHPARPLDPRRFRLRRGNRAEEPRLAPRERPAREGGAEPWSLGQARSDEGKARELTPGDAETLARVVAEPEAEMIVATEGEEASCRPPEREARASLESSQANERGIELGGRDRVETQNPGG